MLGGERLAADSPVSVSTGAARLPPIAAAGSGDQQIGQLEHDAEHRQPPDQPARLRGHGLVQIDLDGLHFGQEPGLDLFDLFLQAQLRLPQLTFSGKVVDLRKAGLERIVGLGDEPGTGLLVPGFGQLLVELECGAHVRHLCRWGEDRLGPGSAVRYSAR